MALIKGIWAREVLDSRGWPTVECTLWLDSGGIVATSVPSGTSVGKYEAKELRDGDNDRMLGKGVLKAVHNINKEQKEQLKNIRKRLKDNKLVINMEGINYRGIYKLKEKLKNTIVGGIKNISQVLPIKKGRDYMILTAGSNLEDVFHVKGVDTRKTTTNNLFEVADVLGIEAARNAIVSEITNVLNKQGLDINQRHIELVADSMTASGRIKGITRTGIVSDKSSVLARASFEIPIAQFVDAGMKGISDRLNSVIENLILNQPVPIGTGLPGLLVTVEAHDSLVKPKMK